VSDERVCCGEEKLKKDEGKEKEKGVASHVLKAPVFFRTRTEFGG
jgi:hypothetical protein